MEEKRREERVAILRQSRLCRNLEEKELLNLMEQEGTVRTYSRGERIFQETDRPDSVYMLLNGSVIIAKETFSGKRILLAQLENPGALKRYGRFPGEPKPHVLSGRASALQIHRWILLLVPAPRQIGRASCRERVFVPV